MDASNAHAEEQIQAVNQVLKELDFADKPALLVLNKVDRVVDPSYVQVLERHHPRAVTISAVQGKGIDTLAETVMEMLSADFTNACVETDAGNGRVLSYLSAHAEIYRQEYHDDKVAIHCYLPRHLLHHIQGPTVRVRFLDEVPPAE